MVVPALGTPTHHSSAEPTRRHCAGMPFMNHAMSMQGAASLEQRAAASVTYGAVQSTACAAPLSRMPAASRASVP